MTTKTDPARFTCPGLAEGTRVAAQLGDGTLIEGYWSGGEFHVMPPEPVGTIETGVIKLRKVAPWRIHKHLMSTPRVWPWREPQWAICIQYVGHCEPVFHSDRAAVVFEAFAAGGAR